MDEYGAALYRDLLFYYNVDLRDTASGEGLPPKLILPLIEGLPDDSMLHAMHAGGIGYLGWGQDRQILAFVYDALRDLTLVTGADKWKRSNRPKFKPWPRPWDKSRNPDGTPKKKKKATVKDLYRLFGGAGRKY